MMIIVHGPGRAMGDNKAIFSYLLKLSYILAEKTGVMGYMCYYISLLEVLAFKSNLEKLKIMLKELDPITEEANIEQVKGYIKNLNDYAQWKHKPSDLEKKFHHYEHQVMLAFNVWREHQKKELQNDGYSYLLKLIDGKAIGYYYLEEEVRINKNMRSGLVSMENLIRLRFPDAEKDTNLMIFHDGLLRKKVIGDIHSCLATDIEAYNPYYTYFYYVATIPNMNTLTEAELRAIRIALQEPLKPIQKMMDEWCILCNDAPSKTESLQYFNDQLIPLFGKVNDSLHENDIWKFALDMNSPVPHYLFMGEITKEAILTYYTFMGLLTTDKCEAMKKIFIEEGEYERRIPMMFISNYRNPDLPTTNYEEEEISEVMIKRKMIEV